MKDMPNARSHPDLVEPTRALLEATGLPWIIENVPGAPLHAGPPSLFTPLYGVTLCGTMFGLNNGEHELRRHRLFESNIPLGQPACHHTLPVIGFYGDHARTRQRVAGHKDRGGDITGTARKMALVDQLMGIDWMAWTEANQAIPPAYTEFLGGHLIGDIAARAGALARNGSHAEGGG
jgi:DNA (cytosine-5)-methyltransferase 1